ncbi:glutathione S-transferase C-terminal domain-containing protein, partial [Hyphomonas sp.]|uniref:glutathione S-transferase C-terminal domain-containing protein n=1 Tax=Hyphomonas sp. TaxID=87 RepID=UPI003569B325
MPTELRARSRAMKWLMWQMAGFGPMHGQAHHFIRYAPEGQLYAVERYRNEAVRLMGVLERRLADAPYLAGEEFSVADISVWPWVRATRAIELSPDPYPSTQRWFATIGERPAIASGTEVKNAANLASLRPTLTVEQWSNLFGENMLRSGA